MTVAFFATSATATVTFEWAPIGNAGNAPDPQTGFGAVSYNYSISKHEVTVAQYVEFLNAVDPAGNNALKLYNTMHFTSNKISRMPHNPTGAKFVIELGYERLPIDFVTFVSAMRFTNWLHNGQGDGDTETGAYAIAKGFDEVRSANARHWIPSEDEWYKAAYHDASAGTAGVYFDYATGSDNAPVSDRPEENPLAVNYYNDDGIDNDFNDGFAVSPINNIQFSFPGYSMPGAYSGAASPYGTFDQNGNVWEWNEGIVLSTLRGKRGGDWTSNLSGLRSAARTGNNPSIFEFEPLGFRVATIPEPSTLALGAILGAVLWMRKRAWTA